MKEDLNRFAPHVKEYILGIVRKWHPDKRYEAISHLSDPNSVPCIVIALWLGEEFGYTDELKAKYDVLYRYYNFSEIKGKPASCPW